MSKHEHVSSASCEKCWNPKETWQERFEEKYPAYDEVIPFITSLLKERDEELVEKIESMKLPIKTGDTYQTGKNSAFNEVIDVIKSRE